MVPTGVGMRADCAWRGPTTIKRSLGPANFKIVNVSHHQIPKHVNQMPAFAPCAAQAQNRAHDQRCNGVLRLDLVYLRPQLQ